MLNLLHDFYTLETLQNTAPNTYCALITLNAEHPIFKGHFPDNPVTPGVCMLHIVKMLTQQITGYQLFLTQTSQVKFAALINPLLQPQLTLTLTIQSTSTTVEVKNITTFSDVVALKLTNSYRIVK